MLVGGRHDASFLTKFQPVRVHTLRTPLLSIQQQAYKLISHGRITRTRFGTTCAAADHHSFYQVLEIPSDATLSEVKTAYRRLAKRWHPDQCTSSEARDIYQTIRDAYDVLSNHTKRHHYNVHGVNGLGPQFHRYEATECFSTAHQHGGQGQNVEAMLGLTFMEAVLGTERVFQVSVRLQCPDCSGSGLSSKAQPQDCTACSGTGQTVRCHGTSLGRTKSFGTCPACGGKGVSSRFWCKACGGEGRAVTPRNVRVKIPAGVDHGSVLRLNGQGDAGTFGGKRGDVLLRFVIHSEDTFTRQGCDVYSTVPVLYLDAILGGQLEVQTLRGITTIQIKPGTQHGTIIRLAGQGVQVWGATTAAFGAHYLTLHVLVPLECSLREQQLLEQLQTVTKSSCDEQNTQSKSQHRASANANAAAACAA